MPSTTFIMEFWQDKENNIIIKVRYNGNYK